MFRSFGRRAAFRPDSPSSELGGPQGPIPWRRLFSFLAPHRGRVALASAALMVSSGLSLVFPVVIRSVVDSVFVEHNLQLLNQITLGLLLVFLLRSVSSLVENYTLNFVGEQILVDLRLSVYRHLQTLSLDFFQSRRVGELVSRLTNDVSVVRTALTRDLSTLLQQALVLIGAVGLMLYLNARLTAFILVLAPVMGAMAAGFGLFLRRASTRVQDELALSTVVVEEVLQSIRVVKSFVREAFEIERYRQAVGRAFEASIRLLRIRAVFGPSVGFLGFSSLALILWFGGREVLAGRLTGGELIAFLIYGMTVAGSVGALVSLYTNLQEALGASERVFQLLDEMPLVRDAADAGILARVEGRIQFEEVHFGYEDGQHVLRGISLEIAPGEILALVGPSGAGKSTVFNLIPRLYDPVSGAIRIDGVDLRTVTQASLRQQIGIVPQETILFGGTVEENIRYGRLDATRQEIEAAARAANAHGFIEELTQGYATVVGERGVRLSGGQRQRVAIARAVLKDPRILLLDEATSSLDSESEQLVQDALSRLMVGRTTVIIAHRLSTVRVAHRIAVLDRGRLVELGSHEALLAKQGLYARLYAMQFREDVTASL